MILIIAIRLVGMHKGEKSSVFEHNGEKSRILLFLIFGPPLFSDISFFLQKRSNEHYKLQILRSQFKLDMFYPEEFSRIIAESLCSLGLSSYKASRFQPYLTKFKQTGSLSNLVMQLHHNAQYLRLRNHDISSFLVKLGEYKIIKKYYKTQFYIIWLEFYILSFARIEGRRLFRPISLESFPQESQKHQEYFQQILVSSALSSYKNGSELQMLKTLRKEQLFKEFLSLRKQLAKLSDNSQPLNKKQKDWELFFEKGNKKRQMQDYQGAIKEYKWVIRLKPDYTDAYFYRGICKDYLKDDNAAIADYNKVISINPSYANAYIYRGISKDNIRDYQEAIKDFNKGIELSPEYAPFYIYRAITKENSGDNEGASKDCDQAIRINPQYADAYIKRGISKDRMKDYDGAIQDFNQAISLQPKYPNTYIYRGNAKHKQKNYIGAIEDYAIAISINPDYDAYIDKGNSKYKMKYYEQAIEDYDQAVKLLPNEYVAFFNKGYVKKEMQNYKGAIEDFNIAISIDPDDFDAFLNRGICKQKLQDFDGAHEDFIEAGKLNPNFAEVYKNAQMDSDNEKVFSSYVKSNQEKRKKYAQNEIRHRSHEPKH